MTTRIHAVRLFGSVDALWFVVTVLVGATYAGGAT